MGDSEAYIGGAIIVGFIVILASVWYGKETGDHENATGGFVLGAGLFAVGFFLAQAEWQQWYCSACGQKVGQGEKPDRCQRCGSNRLTTNDPGAGQKVRVEMEGGGRQRRDQRQPRDRRPPRDRRR